MGVKKRVKNLLPDLAWQVGYDMGRSKKQLLLESHLARLFPLLGIDLVFDVGAHRGDFVRLLRNKLGYDGDIHSFEPQPQAFAALAAAAAADDRWFVHECALGDTEATAALNISQRDVFTSLHDASDFGRANYAGRVDTVDSVDVRVRRLDEVIAEAIPDFDRRTPFLKMDTQGHDKQVFEGAGQRRKQLAGLMSELSVLPIYANAPGYLEMLAGYHSWGFELTGLYTVSREKQDLRLVELDCVFARSPAAEQRASGRGP